jgi:membrane protease YdiL (CAAX protease family)
MFAYSPLRKSKDYKEIVIKTLPFFAYLFVALFIFGILLGYVVFDPKLPEAEIVVLWTVKMLFFTVLVEELFFRFFIQQNVIAAFKKFKNGEIIGLVISSLLFGLFHFSGGLNFVILASISGFLYGFVYIRTKYLESAILLHFVINAVHFFLFSYPHYLKISA